MNSNIAVLIPKHLDLTTGFTLRKDTVIVRVATSVVKLLHHCR